MVSVGEAKSKLREAKELANCDPNEYYRDFLVARSSDEEGTAYDFEKIKFHSPIQTELNRNLTEQIQGLLSDLEDNDGDENSTHREIAEFSVSNRAKKPLPIQYIAADDIPQLDRARSALNDLTINTETDFTETDDIKYQAFRIKDNFSPDLVAFRRFTSTQVVGSSFRVKVALFGTQQYDKLQENPVALPDRFDAIYYDGLFFILNANSFEVLFDYFEAYQTDANEVWEFIESSDINIRDFERVKDTVSRNNNSLRKMRLIKEDGLYDELTRDGVEKMITEWETDVYVEENADGEWEICISDFRKVGEILKLLNNDLVASGWDIINENEEVRKFAAGQKEPR